MNNKRSSTSHSQNTPKKKTAGKGSKPETARRAVDSPVGLISITAASGGILSVEFVKKDPGKKKGPAGAEKWIDATEAKLKRYFNGEIRALSALPLIPEGTEFQQKVWRALTKVPAGKTVSYQQIAKAVGSPKAARAVGTACSKNQICLFIPCHRIVAENKKLGGFSGGIDKKKILLRHEGSFGAIR